MELLALLAGRAGQGIHYPEMVTTWLATNSVEPLGWLIERAVQSLDRIATPPSGLLEIWTDRGEVERWRAAMDDLKARVLAISISR